MLRLAFRESNGPADFTPMPGQRGGYLAGSKQPQRAARNRSAIFRRATITDMLSASLSGANERHHFGLWGGDHAT